MLCTHARSIRFPLKLHEKCPYRCCALTIREIFQRDPALTRGLLQLDDLFEPAALLGPAVLVSTDDDGCTQDGLYEYLRRRSMQKGKFAEMATSDSEAPLSESSREERCQGLIEEKS
jgi:hypothetical protein